MTASELKAIVDPVVAALQKQVGERGAVIVMAAAPQGTHDVYYVAWDGPCLMAKGLREQGTETLQELIRFKDPLPGSAEKKP